MATSAPPILNNPFAHLDAPVVGGAPYFLTNVLSTPAGALPKGPLWLVVFDSIPLATILRAPDFEPQTPSKWDIEASCKKICNSDAVKGEKGCILTQFINIPGEGITTNITGLQYNGLIRGRVGAGRDEFKNLTIGFLNTNVSFVDNVIRPWTIMTSHLGMVARTAANEIYRTNLTIYKLGVTQSSSPPFPIQTFKFYGVCPVTVNNEDCTYEGNGTSITKTADFAYHWYTVDSSQNQFNNL
jgi:hypothetical protein